MRRLSSLNQALADARETYVRRHPFSLARHILDVAAHGGTTPGTLPFRLALATRQAGHIVTADGHVLVDCRSIAELTGTRTTAAATAEHKRRTLLYLEMLEAGFLVSEDARLAIPSDPADAARLRAALAAVRRRDAALS